MLKLLRDFEKDLSHFNKVTLDTQKVLLLQIGSIKLQRQSSEKKEIYTLQRKYIGTNVVTNPLSILVFTHRCKNFVLGDIYLGEKRTF